MTPPLPLPAALDAKVRQRFGRLPGRYALAFEFGGERYGVAEEVPYPAASVIKLPLMVLALRAAERGELDLDERVTLRAEHLATGSGVLQDLDLGLAPTWRDLVRLMIVVSDNLATNLVLERLGVSAVNVALPGLGMPHSRVEGPLQVEPERQTARQRAGHGAATCAGDVLRLLLALDEGALLGPEATAWARATLSAQRYREAIPRLLGGEAPGEGGVLVGNKGAGCAALATTPAWCGARTARACWRWWCSAPITRTPAPASTTRPPSPRRASRATSSTSPARRTAAGSPRSWVAAQRARRSRRLSERTVGATQGRRPRPGVR